MDKNGKHFHEQRFFSPFILSIDGMIGEEALVVLTKLSRLIAAKWKKPFYMCMAVLTVGSQYQL